MPPTKSVSVGPMGRFLFYSTIHRFLPFSYIFPSIHPLLYLCIFSKTANTIRIKVTNKVLCKCDDRGENKVDAAEAAVHHQLRVRVNEFANETQGIGWYSITKNRSSSGSIVVVAIEIAPINRHWRLREWAYDCIIAKLSKGIQYFVRFDYGAWCSLYLVCIFIK